MIKYFQDLLFTLKNIERYLKILSGCVGDIGHDERRKKPAITTKHWNDRS